MIFICEKCSKRVGAEDKHAGHRMASKLKQRVKKQFGKREIRVVMTSCMDACPEDAIAVALQRFTPAAAPMFLQADPRDPEASSESLLTFLGDPTDG